MLSIEPMAYTRQAPGRLSAVLAQGILPNLCRTARTDKGHPGPVRSHRHASHDAACKLLFSFPAMVRDLLAGFFPREWVEELDLSTLERWLRAPSATTFSSVIGTGCGGCVAATSGSTFW